MPPRAGGPPVGNGGCGERGTSSILSKSSSSTISTKSSCGVVFLSTGAEAEVVVDFTGDGFGGLAVVVVSEGDVADGLLKWSEAEDMTETPLTS